MAGAGAPGWYWFRFITHLLSIEVTLERVEVAVPEPAVRLEPGIESEERLRLELIDALLRVAAARDEPRIAQHLEMLRDRGLLQRQRANQIVHALRFARQATEDAPPRGFGEGGESVHPAVI